MINGLTNYEKFKVIRPLFGEHENDNIAMPLIHKVTENMLDLSAAKAVSSQNLNCKRNNSDKIVLSFAYDKFLKRKWENPLKDIPKFQSALAVCTPDFSIYPEMNYYKIAYNIYKNRWLGCLWQDYGCTVLPTVSWATAETYDICFSGIEPGGIVVISTIGCLTHRDLFLNGFNEMRKRIKPCLVVVFGKMIPGMTGRFLNYQYHNVFVKKVNFQQLELINSSKIFEIKEGN